MNTPDPRNFRGAYYKGSPYDRPDLVRLRIEARLTQTELAALAGVSYRTVIRAEAGKASPTSVGVLLSVLARSREN